MAQTGLCIEVTWNISPCVSASCSDPLRFITYPATIPKPTSWRTTSCIHHQHPAGGRWERQKMCCAGGTGMVPVSPTGTTGVLYRFRSILPAVHCGYKLWAEYVGPYRPRRWPAGGQRRYLTPVLEGCKPERRYTHHRAFTIFLLRYLALVCTNAFRLLKPVSNPVFHFCESIWAEIFYFYYAYYSYYDNCANAHNILQLL